jgi:7-carboxy-7-deazaguanine synthase
MKERIRISEIFGPTIQGEGPLIGRPTVFVRTGGCDYRCSWCDTLYAVLPEYHDEWVWMTAPRIIALVNELAGGNPVLVSVSGGNPALQPLHPLIALGRRKGHSFALETQGSVAQPWFAELDWLILERFPAELNRGFPIVRE